MLQRYSDNGDSTLGLLFKRLETPKLYHCCFTLEDEYRKHKVKGETRIWAGEYEIRLREVLSPLTQKYRDRFPWFRWHLELVNVPLFQYVYIHVGNDDDDTDACILVGDTAVSHRAGNGFIGHSADAYERLYRELYPHLAGGGRAVIEIRDENHLW
jgi:hypothetical protein